MFEQWLTMVEPCFFRIAHSATELIIIDQRYHSLFPLLCFISEANQVAIVQMGALPYLHSIMQISHGETLAAAIAALRNLSIHRVNEVGHSNKQSVSKSQKGLSFSLD